MSLMTPSAPNQPIPSPVSTPCCYTSDSGITGGRITSSSSGGSTSQSYQDYREWEAEDIPISEEEEEYLKWLFDEEIKDNVGLPAVSRESSIVPVNGDWIKYTRREAVEYIRRTSESNRFRRQTAYMAIAYYDAIVSKGLPVSEEAEKHLIFQLSAVACLTLASKYEEVLAVDFSMFPAIQNFEFDYKILLRTELIILSMLNWRMQILTPFAFTYYFVSKFSDYKTTASSSSIWNITSKAETIIFNAVIEDENIMKHYKASTIAAAGALLIIDGNLIKESMEFRINALSLNKYLRIEEILCLYNQLRRQLENGESVLSTPIPSPIPVLIQLEKKNGECNRNRQSLQFVSLK